MSDNIWRDEFMHHRLSSEAEDRERKRASELPAPTGSGAAVIDDITSKVLAVVSPEGYDPEDWEQIREAVAEGVRPLLPNACVSDGPADAPELTRSAEGPFAARNG